MDATHICKCRICTGIGREENTPGCPEFTGADKTITRGEARLWDYAVATIWINGN